MERKKEENDYNIILNLNRNCSCSVIVNFIFLTSQLACMLAYALNEMKSESNNYAALCSLLLSTLMHSTSQLLMRSTCTTHFHFAIVIVLSNNKLMLAHVMYFILEWHYTSQISSGLLFVFIICESCPLKINIFHLGLLTMHSKLQALLLKSAASFESL